MNLEQMKARLAEIVARTVEIEKIEALSEENYTEINALSEEFEGLKPKIEAQEKMLAIGVLGPLIALLNLSVQVEMVTSHPEAHKKYL